MQSLDMLTINEDMRSKEDLVEMMWKAFGYFPDGVWEGVNFVGNVTVKCDFRVKSKEDILGAFLFSHLLKKVRKLRSRFGVDNLLLGVTHDPVIALYYRLEGGRLKRVVNLVHDYVTMDVGVISWYETEEEVAEKVAAHGLGHHQGLEHHLQPVDLMYKGLLRGEAIRIDGFCDECQKR